MVMAKSQRGQRTGPATGHEDGGRTHVQCRCFHSWRKQERDPSLELWREADPVWRDAIWSSEWVTGL